MIARLRVGSGKSTPPQSIERLREALPAVSTKALPAGASFLSLFLILICTTLL